MRRFWWRCCFRNIETESRRHDLFRSICKMFLPPTLGAWSRLMPIIIISVPYKYIFYPLLSTVGPLIGVNEKVLIWAGWTEPSCIWVLVAARMGEKKSACANLLKGAVQKSIEEDIIQRQWIKNAEDGSNQEKPPKLQLHHFSFEALHSCLCCM